MLTNKLFEGKNNNDFDNLMSGVKRKNNLPGKK